MWYFYWTQKSWGGGVDGWLGGQNTTNKDFLVLCLCLCVRTCDHIFYISFPIFTLLVWHHISQNLNLCHCEKVTVTWQQQSLLLSFGGLTDHHCVALCAKAKRLCTSECCYAQDRYILDLLGLKMQNDHSELWFSSLFEPWRYFYSWKC